MPVRRTVLLARPHPFIASEMRPFLESAGFSPATLETIADLGTTDWGTPCGAIISTAVRSSVDESAETVFRSLRAAHPRIPVVFAGAMDSVNMNKAVALIVKSVHADAEILPVSAATEKHALLGRPDVLVVVRKDDLVAPESRATAERMLRRHFL